MTLVQFHAWLPNPSIRGAYFARPALQCSRQKLKTMFLFATRCLRTNFTCLGICAPVLIVQLHLLLYSFMCILSYSLICCDLFQQIFLIHTFVFVLILSAAVGVLFNTPQYKWAYPSLYCRFPADCHRRQMASRSNPLTRSSLSSWVRLFSAPSLPLVL